MDELLPGAAAADQRFAGAAKASQARLSGHARRIDADVCVAAQIKNLEPWQPRPEPCQLLRRGDSKTGAN